MAALASLPSTRTYECARCGKRQRPDRMVFSTYTHLRYCANIDDCARRAKRAKH